MKVLMLRSVGGVGQEGHIVEVADGFALNSLIPSGKAVQATAEKVKQHEAQQKVLADQRQKHEAALKTMIQSLENAEIVFATKATDKGGLFKSIVANDIAKAIYEQKNATIPLEAIALPKPIKETGAHPITIKAAGAAASITFVVKGN
ncbi:MAG TPA: 50S ribosomal protein L9 [Candidatus Paceibacterota bacterium]|jgi:large subunit ribosomal protein L9|nr:50S ribosomal protein L9 [Candidatus Paceibacterota bacterium]